MIRRRGILVSLIVACRLNHEANETIILTEVRRARHRGTGGAGGL